MLLLLLCGIGCKTTPHWGGKYVEMGKASWYGDEYQGKTTASGEVFDPNALTAAHKKLPFQTLVFVKNLLNGRTVQVHITDRGPFKRGRIIDVSKAAAVKLAMVEEGVVPVRIEVVRWGPRARK